MYRITVSFHFIWKTALFILLLLSNYALGQERRLLCFDLISKETDTLYIPEFDTLIINEKTRYNTGIMNDYYNNLDFLPPSENSIPGTQFSYKRRASLDYDINNFPIRTSVKLFKWENDSIKSKCSGSMISRKHVLTACHCVAQLNEDSLLYDSLFVCPVIDNGVLNNNFDCSWVRKIFFFENWGMSYTDFAVLELEEPVGEKTGWISIGFDSNDSSLLDGIYYKFSYPATTLLALDSNNYNGDTLYYCYGIADIVADHAFGVEKANGIPGESGSSLIKVENENSYTSYGVFSLSVNLMHSRLTNWKYYAFKSIIMEDLELKAPNRNEDNFITIYPNPTVNKLNIVTSDRLLINKIMLFGINGRKLIERDISASEAQVDVSGIPEGTYLLVLFSNERKIIKKIIKYRR